MIILYAILAAIISSKSSEDELTEAACVIFSRYVLQVQSDLASPPIGKLINEKKMQQDDAIYVVQSAALDKCLLNIKQREVTRILDALQNQDIDLKKYQHLYQGVQFDHFIDNQKEKTKLNELIDIIKDVEELLSTQWKPRNEPEQQKQKSKGEEIDVDLEAEETAAPQQQFDITKIPFKQILFRNKENLIFVLFALVPAILLLKCCFKQNKKPKQGISKKEEIKKDLKPKEKTESKEEDKEKVKKE